MLGEPPVTPAGDAAEDLRADLVAMLQALRAAEREILSRIPPEALLTPMPGDRWSPKDVQAHLAAWRRIEARRLLAAARGAAPAPGDPLPEDDVDTANERLYLERATREWEAVRNEAEQSVAELITAIGLASVDQLCQCDVTAAGIGANGVNHGIGHLGELAELAGARDVYTTLAAELEGVLRRGHLPPRDSATILYNIACHCALTGQLDEARRLLSIAFRRRHDLVEWASSDPDLALLRTEISALATAG
jgi:hypothetical protein